MLTKHSTVIIVSHVHSWPNIPLQLAGIVAKPTVWARCSAVQSTDRAQVNRHISKRTSLDKTTPDSSRNLNLAKSIWGHENGAIMLNALAIPSQTSGAAVEDGRVLRSRRILGPVPVLAWLSVGTPSLVGVGDKRVGSP